MNILVVSSLEVPSIIWLKMQMWLAAKFQWFLDLLHKRLPGQDISKWHVCTNSASSCATAGCWAQNGLEASINEEI